jgi:hypothetical protein
MITKFFSCLAGSFVQFFVHVEPDGSVKKTFDSLENLPTILIKINITLHSTRKWKVPSTSHIFSLKDGSYWPKLSMLHEIGYG